MGAHGFSEFSENTDVRAAYRELCDIARDEHGNDGYNGTISTTCGISIVQSTPVSFERAEEIEAEYFNNPESFNSKYGTNIDKRDNAGAIRVKGKNYAGLDKDGWWFFGWAAS